MDRSCGVGEICAVLPCCSPQDPFDRHRIHEHLRARLPLQPAAADTHRDMAGSFESVSDEFPPPPSPPPPPVPKVRVVSEPIVPSVALPRSQRQSMDNSSPRYVTEAPSSDVTYHMASQGGPENVRYDMATARQGSNRVSVVYDRADADASAANASGLYEEANFPDSAQQTPGQQALPPMAPSHPVEPPSPRAESVSSSVEPSDIPAQVCRLTSTLQIDLKLYICIYIYIS